MNKATHSLAALVLLAWTMHGTTLMAQHRIAFLSPEARGTKPRTASPRLAALQEVPSQSVLEGQTRVSDSLDSLASPDPDAGASIISDSPMLDDELLSDGGVGDAYAGEFEGGVVGRGAHPTFGLPYGIQGWVGGEYLMWWPRPMDVPVLVTSGTAVSEGALGAGGTETLVGGELLDQMYSGARLRIGLWADPFHQHAWEADGFYLGEATDRYEFSGTGATNSSVLARPFFNVLTSTNFPNGLEDAELVAYPGELRGTVTVEANSRLYGVGVHGMRTFCATNGCAPAVAGCGSVPVSCHLSGFAGWRYLNLGEDLRINENLTSLLESPDNGQFLIEDLFETSNMFNGADLGAAWKTSRGPWTLDLLMRMAVGSTHQKVCIDGSTTITGSSDPANNIAGATGGLLAQRTNIGAYERNQFAVVPELGVTLGYALTPQWRATVGYTFLYWSSVVRPGDQIDRDVNPNLIPPEMSPLTGLERPVFNFVESDLWVNGLSLGLERTW